MTTGEREFPDIVFDPGILGGQPRIRGTRISVALILELVAGGATVDDMVREYPQIPRARIEEALHYAAEFFRRESVFTATLS